MTLLSSSWLALLLFFGSGRDSSIQGTYWSCLSYRYVELEFSDSHFVSRWGKEEFEGEKTYYYELDGDTLVYSSLPFNIVTTEEEFVRVSIKKNRDNLILDFGEGPMSFQRMDIVDEVKPQRKDQNFGVIWYSEDEEEFNQRLSASKCP